MRIHLYKNKCTTYYNCERWKESKSPIILITGLCGSGKTTFAKKMAKITNTTLVSFDVLKFYDKATKDSQLYLDEFLNCHPEIINLVKIHWKNADDLYSKYCNLFFDFLKNYCKQKNEMIILEGIQVFVRLNPKRTINMPLIVIGSCSVRSYINKFKRDYHNKNFIFYNCISDLYIYHIKQLFLLNKYLNYYEKYNC